MLDKAQCYCLTYLQYIHRHKGNRALYVFFSTRMTCFVFHRLSVHLKTCWDLGACVSWERIWLNMSINVTKSSRLHAYVLDTEISLYKMCKCHRTSWVNEMRYLGIIIKRGSCTFKCSLDQPKRAYYREPNWLFGKVARTASEDVVIQLLSSKCVSILLYGLDVCCLNKTELNSLDFVIKCFVWNF